MTKELKRRCIIYGVGVALYIILFLITRRYVLSDWLQFFLFLIVYLIVGFEAFKDLRDNLLNRRFLTEYTMIILATVGAFGIQRYAEGVLVMILFELGMIFEAVSSDRARNTIQKMIDIRPEYANRKVKGEEVRVDPSELKRNHIIIIKPGERIPVDAVVTSGTTMIDTKAVTGEPVPRSVGVGDRIYSGCINLQGVIEARVSKVYKDSTVSKIMDMIEDAENRKAESETFFTRFTKVYTPVMVLISLLVMIIPSITFSFGNWSTWIYRGLIFLIVACPSELAISIPLAFLGGIASSARQGILIKGSNYLEYLSQADTFVFDKTGTLTEGAFTVREVRPVGMDENELLCVAAHVESYSNHPIAQSILTAYDGEVDKEKVSGVRETPGYGVSATYDGERVHVGNQRLMEKQNIEVDEVDEPGTVVYVCMGKRYAGYIRIADEIREDARWTLGYLKNKCKSVLVMLTGDSAQAGKEVADELEMDYAYADLLPKDKLEILEEFLEIEDNTEKLVCVGDGINDAPVLARADVGVAMGALGSAAAIDAADVVLMEDELPKIVDVIHISKATLRVINQNMWFSIIVKAVVLILALIGFCSMWEAIIVEVGVMVVALLNAVCMINYEA